MPAPHNEQATRWTQQEEATPCQDRLGGWREVGTPRDFRACMGYQWRTSSIEREFFIDNLLVRIHLIIVTIRWTDLEPWEFEFPFPGSLTSTFLRTLYTLGLRAFRTTHFAHAVRGDGWPTGVHRS